MALPPRPPLRTSTTGAKWLTFTGIALLVIAFAAGITAVVKFISMVPVGIINMDGTTGDRVLVAVQPGETGTAVLDANSIYQVWWITSDPSVTQSQIGTPRVNAPDGTPVSLAPAFVSCSASMGAQHGRCGWQFTTAAAGTYTITAIQGKPDVTIAVAPGTNFAGFFGGVALTILAWFVAIGGGLLGAGMTIGGAIWWHARKKNARTAG
jgi:hypothetical protein